MITHVVKSDDTLPGLALRYGVNMATIKKANKLFGTDIQAYRSLNIPVLFRLGNNQCPSAQRNLSFHSLV